MDPFIEESAPISKKEWKKLAKKKIINPQEDLRIEEEISSHMEENNFHPNNYEEYGNWLNGYINTQQKLLK